MAKHYELSGLLTLALVFCSTTATISQADFADKKENTETGGIKYTSKGSTNEEYHEELVVQTLPDGFVNTYFQFSTRWRYGTRENCENAPFIM